MGRGEPKFTRVYLSLRSRRERREYDLRADLRETLQARRALDVRLKQLDRRRRRDVTRAVRRGRPVADPRDAQLALDLARHVQRIPALIDRGPWSRQLWRVHLVTAPLVIGVGIWRGLAGDWLGWFVAGSAAYAIAAIWAIDRYFSSLRAGARRAQDLNKGRSDAR